MAREIELKLAFPPEARQALSAHPLIAMTTRIGQIETLENTYFDTPDLALGKALVAVRTRRIGERWLQTIKSANTSAGGLSSRPEWEQPFDTTRGRFDFSVVDDVATRALLEHHTDRIAPLFTTIFERETREFSPRPGVRILLMIDSGSVRVGTPAPGRETPISELELELAEGEARDLLDYALQLGAELPLMPEDISKAHRGYLLLHNTPPQAIRAKRLTLNPTMTPPAAFSTLAFECLHGWQGNALGALLHDEPEFIHQLRVALRRLRTLLKVFDAHLPLGFVGNWQLQLGSLANQLGRARDLDVMHGSLLRGPLAETGAPNFALLLSHLERTTQTARAEVQVDLRSVQARLLLLQFSKALHTLPAETESEDLPKFAREALRTLHKRALKKHHTAQQSNVREDLHRVRIALKRLRYALEFFGSLFDDIALGAYRRKLGEVLEELGELNDIDVGRALLSQWAAAHQELGATHTWINAWHTAQDERRSRKALREVAELLDLPSPWKNFRNVDTAK